jgi:hypothetical protein
VPEVLLSSNDKLSLITNRARTLIAVAVFYFISSLMAVALLWRNDWRGTGDLGAFIFWSIPLSVMIALVNRQFEFRREEQSFMSSWYLWNALFGVALSSIWSLVVAFMLGGAFGAFSFSVLYCWAIGSVTALSVPLLLRQPSSSPLALAIFLTISFGGWFMVAAASAQPADLLVTIRSDADAAQINAIYETVLGTPSPSGRGYTLDKSISGVGRLDNDSNPRLQVSFWPMVSESERQHVRQLLSRSPIVIAIEDMPPMAPGEIKIEVRTRKTDKDKGVEERPEAK